MDPLDHEAADVSQMLYDMNVELLADIEAGRAQQSYSPVEIEALREETARLKSLVIAAREAQTPEGALRV
jgi:hypothetical protein